MKKLVFPLLGGLALIATGCSNDETVEVPKGHAIAFENAFVNKTGRATDLSSATPNFKDLKVWGTSSVSDAYIFDAQTLTVNGQMVTYTPPRYWDKNATYHFMAIGSPVTTNAWTYAPGDVRGIDHTGAFGTLQFNNETANGQEDLAYATADHTTGATIDSEAAVPLNFEHLLSRLRFTFISTMDNGYSIEVTNVKVMDLPKTGTLYFDNPVSPATAMVWQNSVEKFESALTLAPKGESQTADTDPVLYGLNEGANTETFFTLPSAESFKIHFEINLYLTQGSSTIKINDDPYVHEVEVLATQKGEDGSDVTGLLMGTAYQFIAQIGPKNINPDGMKPIEFTVSVKPINTAGANTIYSSDPTSTSTEEGK